MKTNDFPDKWNRGSRSQPAPQAIIGHRIVSAKSKFEPLTNGLFHGPSTQRFLARCWCEATEVEVTPADVKAGRTNRCWRKRCKPRA